MNRTHALLLALFVGLALPQLAVAQQNIEDDSGVIDLNSVCHPGGVGQDDGCDLESFSIIYSDTTPSNLHVLAETAVTMDSFDDGFDAFVCTNVTQDSAQISAACASDNGQGVAGLIGNIPINLAGGPYSYAVNTTSYYDFYANGGCESGGTCLAIVNTSADVTLGKPVIDSTSPPYVFVGTSGGLTINGDSMINPFPGAPQPSFQASKSGGTGFTVSGSNFGVTSGTASYSASLTATTGPWDLGLSYFLGNTGLVVVFGSFIVGDPTPSISSVSPNNWTAGQSNIAVTITGSGFGSNPQLTIAGPGISSSITGHSDTGAPGGAKITANVTVALCAPAQTAAVIVTSTGYNGSGFTAAFSGQSSSGSSSATVTPIPAPAPTISFGGKNVTGANTSVVVGQKISLTGTVPSPQNSCLSSQSWSSPPGTAVGGATASTAGGFTLTSVPSNTTSGTYGPYYWPYAGTFNMTFGYKLTNGVDSPNATTTFTVKGFGTAKMSTVNYGKLNDNTLTICNSTSTEKVLAYGNISGTTCNVGGTAGELFTAPTSSPGTGKFTFVQLINSDASTFTSTSGTVTCTHNAGVDKSYPYAAQISATQADDAPYVVLPTSPYNKITRSFSATMYQLWTSSTTNSIPVSVGSITWQFSGATTLSGGKWGNVTGSGTANAFVPSTGGQSNKGYPHWTGPSDQTCN